MMKQIQKLTEALLEKLRQRQPDLPADQTDTSRGFSSSVGLLFCDVGSRPGCAARVIELADHEMYKVKNGQKNGLSYHILSPDTSVAAKS